MILTQVPVPKERNLFLSQQVNQDSINSITKSIVEITEHDMELKKLFSSQDLIYNPKPIKLYIDSYGGSVYQCLGLLGIMQTNKIPIHTIVTGCAMSCGFLISISGHKRFGYKNSTYLYHQVSSSKSGTIKDLEEEIIETKRLQKIIEKITLNRTKITKKRLKDIYKTKYDWFMDTTEALELGVIDEEL